MDGILRFAQNDKSLFIRPLVLLVLAADHPRSPHRLQREAAVEPMAAHWPVGAGSGTLLWPDVCDCWLGI